MKEVKAKSYNGWNTSISMLFGKSPKINILCGECFSYFSVRFTPSDFSCGSPRAFCTNCGTRNIVSITYGSF